jgi:heterotetrameric sarcosine oxidase delta subunit
MLLIPCPWCGPREETEFAAGGEANRVRPRDPFSFDEGAWADFLFMRQNIRGDQNERWFHEFGCRRWLVIQRDTITHIVTVAAEASPDEEVSA